MNDAFAAVYGRDRSLARRLFGPIISPRTYLRTAHLLLMFPVGIAYFVGLVVSFAVGGALIWTIVGPVVLLAALFLTRWAGDIEAWMVRHVTPIELRRPPTAIERGESFRSQVWTRLIDPTTWTGVVYLLVQFPIGIAAFVTVVVVGAVSAAFIGAPFALMFGSEEIDLGFTVLETSTEALWLVPVGMLALFVGIHVLNIASAVHASWARLMLGSRAQRVPGPDDRPGPGFARADAGRWDTPVRASARRAAHRRSVHPSRREPPREVAAAPFGGTSLDDLTPRETQVLQLIARGYSNAEIAEAFVISEGTVKTHVKRLLGKLDLRDRTQAAVFAYEVGFVTPSHVATPLRRVK